MSASQVVQQLSDEIVALASDIIGTSQHLKNRGATEFVRGTSQQRAAIVGALALTPAQVQDLIAAEQGSGGTNAVPDGTKQPQIWDYDTKTATAADLTRRRDLLRTRLRVLEYLRVH